MRCGIGWSSEIGRLEALPIQRAAYLEKPNPHFRNDAAKTRREFPRVFHPAA
jgi:hypothetical protein